MRTLRTAIGLGTYPLLLVGGTLGLAWVLTDHPGGRLYETALVSVLLWGSAALLLLLQHLHPAVPGWRNWFGELRVDLLHSVVSAIAGTTAARVVLFGLVALIAERSGSWGLGWWPADWPLLAQLPLALAVSDFGMYVLHRSSHAVPWMWRFHELHHSSERLYTVSTGRVHPVYIAFSVLAASAPMVVLGAPPPLFALMSAAAGVHGLIQHSNVDLDCRPYRWLLATADAHRWHHSDDPADGGYNFGNTFSIWDRLFGTWRVPTGLPSRVGVRDRAFPRGFFAQVRRPFERSTST